MPAPFIIGWEEWVSLPDLGLPAIKAKIDTGARTSALHAHLIEPFGPADAPLVRFAVHPIAGRTDIEITCSAPIVARREVTSSNGETERRYVIATKARIGNRDWPIEVTLTNRESMAYRMLIGRQAIKGDMYVDPTSSFRQKKLSYKTYKSLPRRDPVRRPLRIAILTRKPTSAGPSRLAAAAADRHHVVERLDVATIELAFDGLLPGLMRSREQVPHFDAVVPRIGGGGGTYARAVLRQMELMGSVSINPADSLDRLANPIGLRQALVQDSIPTTGPAHIGDTAGSGALDSTELRHRLSILIVGRSAIAALESRRDGAWKSLAEPLDREARMLAVRAARSLKLRLCSVEVVPGEETHRVAAISAVPQLARFDRETGTLTEAAVIADLEGQVRSWVRHAEGTAAPEPPAGDA